MQALDDLARAGSAEVVFLRVPEPLTGAEILDPFERAAHFAGFVTARLAVQPERTLDTFDGLVRLVGRALTPPRAGVGQRGVVALLDRFITRNIDAKNALAVFDEGVMHHCARGDLIELARDYVGAGRSHPREAARVDAWLAGQEPARVVGSSVVAPLSLRTARRALVEMTLLSRVLGWRGTVLVLQDVEAVLGFAPTRRADAFGVLRDLVDGADGARAMVAAQVMLAGRDELFTSAAGLRAQRPFVTRVQPPPDAAATLPPPHRSSVEARSPARWKPPLITPSVRPVDDSALSELRAIVRAAQGLASREALASMTVGVERIAATIDSIFSHSAMESSVFAMLTGPHGSGKSHLLTHLAARALADQRPVFRLAVERPDADFGTPQRHLRRLLDQAVLPLAQRPGPLDQLLVWTRDPSRRARLTATLEEIAGGSDEVSATARKALLLASQGEDEAYDLEQFLGAIELMTRSAAPHFRQDAYHRLGLWQLLLQKLEGCKGAVLILDEVENLYRGGVTPNERRAALRSLSFYCGGALPMACVVLAVTPEALRELQRESAEALQDAHEQRSALACEDAAMLRHRLTGLTPLEVPVLPSELRALLPFRVRATHERVRGRVNDPGWATFVSDLVMQNLPPRDVTRRVVDRLEGLWWLDAS